MKKLLIFVATLCLLLALATGALASSVYVEGMVGGTWDDETNTPDDGDLTVYRLGGDYAFGKFKIGLDYDSGTSEDANAGNDVDFTAYELYGGYCVVDQDNLKLYIDLGYYNQTRDVNSDPTFTGIMLGADISYAINEQFLLDGGLEFSATGTVEDLDADDQDVSFLKANLKCTYLFSEDFGAYLGYRYLKATVDKTNDPEITQSGPVLGVVYKF